MATNLAGSSGTLYERTTYAPVDNTDPPLWFQHTPPALPGVPPIYTGWGAGAVTLNSYERSEVDLYLATRTDETLATLRLPDAIKKANDFKTYFATPAYKAWFASDRVGRRSQWKLLNADGIINNKATTSISADATGAGSTPPPPNIPPGTNVP